MRNIFLAILAEWQTASRRDRIIYDMKPQRLHNLIWAIRSVIRTTIENR